MPTSSIRPLAVSGLLAVTVVAFLAAQTQTQQDKPQDPAQQPPKFRVEANFVRVDAYPLKDGKPVLDLKAEDFEVFEDGVAQKIESFEHVVVRPAGPQDGRVEVSSQRESQQAAANPRNRVFVIFVDTPHIQFASRQAITEPLIRLLNRILGPDDLVGVMTPEMAASQVVLGRKTQVIEDSLRGNWLWGTRDTNLKDDREIAYEVCYPPEAGQGFESPVAREMIARKRERATLDALEDLVRYLRTIREERKAILTITEGWLLYGENPALVNSAANGPRIPGLDPITVGPNGKLTTNDPRDISRGPLSPSECDGDRMRLAMMDDRQFFLDLMNEANAGNASFYPVDPRGLAVFDAPIGPGQPPGITVDMAMLKKRIEVMRTLAGNTDGMAVVDSNDLDKGMRRISDDLTSYYLLGYLSTNSKLDGKFRALKVKVKQPGVDVRARRGYRAATESEVYSARKAADAPIPEATRAVNQAIERLGRVRPDVRFRINAISSAGSKPLLWVAGELQGSAGRPDEFALGGTAEIEATAGSISTTAKVPLKPGERTFLATMSLPPGAKGELNIRARLVPADAASLPLTDMLRLETASSGLEPLLFRRGITTGNRMLPAANLQFSRTERLRLELPVDADAKPGKRAPARQDGPAPAGTRGRRRTAGRGHRPALDHRATLALAALSGGDYAVEIEVVGAAKSQRIVSAIRIVK